MAAFLAFIGLPGPTEMVIVLFIILILFGSRLPSLMRNLGRSAVEFKKGVQGMEDDGEPEQHEAKGR
jgi:sec-independent protein translocase protein TatA